MRLCTWKCGRKTSNRSGICSDCWRDAEILRSNTDVGAKAWAERYKAKQAAKQSKPRSEAQIAALAKRNEERAALKVAKISQGFARH